MKRRRKRGLITEERAARPAYGPHGQAAAALIERLEAEGQATSKPARQHTGKTANREAGKLVKATFYLDPADLVRLEEVRLARMKGGERPGRVDKSSLVREAIRLLANRHTSIPVKQQAGRP